MIKIENSKKFQEIVRDIKKKDFNKALEKTKYLSQDYPKNNTILKLFASIYFNLSDWKKAIEYYEKILFEEKDKFKIYTNIGVALFKLGKINHSIKLFEEAIKNNPSFDLAYNNLGISYLEIAIFDKAIENFISALRLNETNLSAEKNLINVLTLMKPNNKNKHSLIELDYHISQIENNNLGLEFFDEKKMKIILDESLQLISKFKKKLFFGETQIFRKNSKNLNCDRHFKVFNKFNIIPKFCFNCYKIQINLENVVELIKLFFIFDNLDLKNNNIRKCMIEMRNQIKGNYKGYIYCEGIYEAKEIFNIIKNKMINSNLNKFKISIKHGCSEFYKPFPQFEKIDLNEDQKMKYNPVWQNKERLIDQEQPERLEIDKKIWKESLKGISLSDILIINNWLNYADVIGDYSYKKISSIKIDMPFIKKFLINQLEFRKENFVS